MRPRRRTPLRGEDDKRLAEDDELLCEWLLRWRGLRSGREVGEDSTAEASGAKDVRSPRRHQIATLAP